MTADLASPGLSAAPVLSELFEELTNKLQAGEVVDIEEYARRHPAYADRLRRFLPALEVLVGLGHSAVPPTQCLPGPAEFATGHAGGAGTLGDYRIVREVGRGGMGVVYEAVQLSLERRVALKVLPFAAALDARQLQRFKNEAQAAAHLQHQSIVPVYAVGCERGVHYYAMQFIDGQTLAALIHDLRGQRGGPAVEDATGPSPPPEAATTPAAVASTLPAATDAAFFRTVAQWGVQAAHALEQAHQVGVVHRDVKPANLMLDGRGNVWITDFGLAHCQSQMGLTMSGDLIGTLRYMSPEQALAQRGLIDHRSDIYSLGATLYELLTLEPAFPGTDRQELLRQLAQDDPRPPRQWNRSIPGELETIVLKAMEKSPAERYATAQDLADDLQRWLKDEPIRAKRPTPLQRVKRWARRHRSVVWAAAVCLLVAALSLAVCAGWILRAQAVRRAEAVGKVTVAVDEARALQRLRQWPEALASARRAQEWVDEVPEQLRHNVGLLMADLEMAARLEEVAILRANAGKGSFDNELADEEYGKAFREFGIDVDTLETEEAAALIQGRSIAVELAAALDAWAPMRRATRKGDARSWKRLVAVARLADPDRQRNQMRDALERGDHKALVKLAASDQIRHWPASTLGRLGVALTEIGSVEQAVALLQKAQQSHPSDFWINHRLAWSLRLLRPPQTEEAVRFFTVAVALRSRSPSAHVNLGVALHHTGRLDAAIAAYQEAIHLKKDLVSAHCNLGSALVDKGQADAAIAACQEGVRLDPGFAEAHCCLGRALNARGRWDEAIAACREAIRLKPAYAQAHNLLGLALMARGRLDEAIAAYWRALEHKPTFSGAHYNLGKALAQRGHLNAAILAYRRAIEHEPDDARPYYQLDDLGSAGVHCNLGVALNAKGRRDEAIAAFREAIRLKPAYALAHCNLGVALDAKGRRDEAVAAYRKAISLQDGHAPAHCNLGAALLNKGLLDEAISELRKAIHAQPTLAEAHSNLGWALSKKGKLDEASSCYREAIKHKPDYANAHCRLGEILAEKKQHDEAIAAYRQAIKHRPHHAPIYYNLGCALLQRGQRDQALAAFRQAIVHQPDLAPAHSNIGLVLLQRGQLDQAIAAFRQAVKHKPDYAEAHYNLGLSLAKKGQLDEAIASYRQSLVQKPDFAEAHCNLGLRLQDAGQFAAALASLRRGHELGARNPKWHYPSARWVQECQRLAALERRLPPILQGAAPADAAEGIAFAQVCALKGLQGAAARLYALAFAAKPDLASNQQAGHRYQAARAAALAGCGQGKDSPPPGTSERLRWRRQALTWLRADLAAWSRLLHTSNPQARARAQQVLATWQGDSALAGLREGKHLAGLPPEEQAACRRLWADVKGLLEQARRT
jgi:tetratricopeptide (TPR) repeat protein